jgi:hypothetical protein
MPDRDIGGSREIGKAKPYHMIYMDDTDQEKDRDIG